MHASCDSHCAHQNNRAALTVSSSRGGQKRTGRQLHHTQTGPSDVHFPAEASFHQKVRHEQQERAELRDTGALTPDTHSLQQRLLY